MENSNINSGLLETLDIRIRTLLEESKDPYYTEYLRKLQNRLIQQKYQVDLIADDLDRSYRMYLQRMEAAPSTEYISSVAGEDDVVPGENREMDVPRIVAPELVKTEPVKRHKDTEFAVGAAVLSVVGGGFILAALVTLGMMFMGGFFKGMCLYAIAIAFTVVAELILYRRWPMLGATFSAIGIGGLYLSTILNYTTLRNFNLWIALVIALVISGFVAWLSRKRDSVLYRIIGIVAGYICFFLIEYGITDTEFIIISVMLLLMNIMFVCWPTRNAGTAVNITHMVVNTFLAFLFLIKAEEDCCLSGLPLYVFGVTSMLVVLAILVKQMFVDKIEAPQRNALGILLTYYICMILYAGLLLPGCTAEVMEMYSLDIFKYIGVLIVGLLGLAALIVLRLGECDGSHHVYSFINIMTLSSLLAGDADWAFAIGLVVLYVVAKLLSLRKNLTIWINDLVLTVWVCGMLLFGDAEYTYLALGAIICGILLIRNWQTCYEIIFTLTLAVYAASELPGMLQLPVCVGILLIGILAFNNVKWWRGKHILFYNYFALAGQVICFICLAFSEYRDSYLTYLCMLIFGLATIVLTLQEQYSMNFRGKYMIFSVFLTYMAFILKTGIPVVNSILLMIIALVCVGLGFAKQKKSVRIFGLALSLFVCGKLIVYDFFQAATWQKMTVLLVVGIIALIIAAIYIILEKRNDAS